MRIRTAIPSKKIPPIWTCPAPLPLNEELDRRASHIFQALRETAAESIPASRLAGRELQVALMLLEDESGLRAADNSFWRAKYQSLLVRPAIEPLACSFWKRLAAFDIDEKLALVLASTLAGRRLVYRKGPATGRSVKGDVAFEPMDIAPKWLTKIATAAQRPELRSALPMFSFAQVIMAHPFSDGNGRFARLMVHASLARVTGLPGPQIALAPAFYRRAETLGRALMALSETGHWQPFNEVFLSTLEDAATLTERLLATGNAAADSPPS